MDTTNSTKKQVDEFGAVAEESVDSIDKENASELGESNTTTGIAGKTIGHRKERWNMFSRVMKGIKAKLHQDTVGKNSLSIDTKADNEKVSSVTVNDGRTLPEENARKASKDLSDTEDGQRRNNDTGDVVDTGKLTSSKTLNSSARTRRRKTRKETDDDTNKATEQNESPTSRALPEALKKNLAIVLSGIYGLIIVVIGLVLPLTEVFISSDHPYFFEVFYLYLYLACMFFLVYVYAYLLRKERLISLNIAKAISRTLSRNVSRSNSLKSSVSEKNHSPAKPLVRYNSTLSSLSIKRRRKIAYNPEVSTHTGSFYLRIGVIGFGIGTMIHSGLTFGHYFEVNHLANHCSNALQAVKPLALLCFTFVQMYFIFMNSKMCIHKYKTLARFGLMHMCCTNICVWLRSLVIETLLVIKINNRVSFEEILQTSDELEDRQEERMNMENGITQSPEEISDDEQGFMMELSCNIDAMMGKIIENSSLYLYPCIIEYSLVCACVLYVMWSNIGEGRPVTKAESCSDFGALDSEDDSDESHEKHKMSVDCAGSSKGLFLGIFLFVVAVICVVCFYVLTSASSHVTTGTLLGHICEEIILIVTFVATIMASVQMKDMHFSANQKVGIEEILTLISICGLGLYGVWSITAALFFLDTIHGRLTIITNLFMLIQAGSQATFTFMALRASARTNEQLRTKPGRQCVTFLLICNFVLWTINSFQTQRLEHNQTQVDFYGTTAWSIFSHISVPLGIYFRFHSTVNLSIVWKKAWKKKTTHSELRHSGHH